MLRAALLLLALVPGGEKKTWIHEPLDELLRENVEAGVVDYAGLKKRESELDKYLGAIAKTGPTGTDREKLAYWINAYNAFTLKLILRHYPKVASITKLEKPWDTAEWKAGGKLYTLNDIEHRVIRKEFAEPRIHFALVCAAKSCPNLRSGAYSGEKLDAQLAEQARTFLRDRTKGVRIEKLPDGKLVVRLSMLFKWYRDDFGDAIGYVLPYLTKGDRVTVEKHRSKIEVEFLPYDWSLNGK